MKIIDLINKMAKGEEVPKKIKYNEVVWERTPSKDYENEVAEYFLDDYMVFTEKTLNDEIEILEEVEDKEYENIEEITYKPRKVQNAINALIRNQQKIIERMKRDE